jgi:hypothetical protein
MARTALRTTQGAADQMNRVLASLLSVLFAYAICAASGVNKWMYIWLKMFYPWYAISMWALLAILFTIFSVRSQTGGRHWAVVGPALGYLSGLTAYQIGPAMRDGSFVRSGTTIASQGLATYTATSAIHPLLCLAPVVGLMTAAMFIMLARREGRYGAAVVVGCVFVIGWGFFLSHGALPVRW